MLCQSSKSGGDRPTQAGFDAGKDAALVILKYKHRLLAHLAHDSYVPVRIGDLAKDLNIPLEEHDAFTAAVRQLAHDADVELSQTGHVALPSLASAGKLVQGTFRKNARGFGFVEPAKKFREGSIFVPAENVADALSGDIVKARVWRDTGGGGPRSSGFSGEIVEVVDRRTSSVSGTLTKRGQQWIVLPDGRKLTQPIVIKDAESSKGREGDKVVVELTAFPDGDVLGEGVITKVLGEAGRPDVETQAIIAAFDLPGEHPAACVEQAREAARSFETQIAAWKERGSSALENRLDLTGQFIITIDPPDAKDYDDAISIKATSDGWELGVHIADVAHFIPPGTALDMEARDRSNSCYLPRHVIPMLPEVLSNGICSLQEGVPRFCKSAFMVYDRHGKIVSEGAAQTLIQSAKRLTYLEAQALIEGDFAEARRHAKTPPKYSDQLIDTLREMDRCAKAILGRRERQGMITLDLPEVVLVYNERGNVVDAEREDDAFTHRLIEMFMVEANEVLARLFEDLNVPLLRRIHPEPVPGDVDTLRKVAMVAGYRVPRNPTREELQGLLKATAGTAAARAVSMAVLRTMTKAQYSPAPIGHFALASGAYAHFTSPIRRYADLTVHRALAAYVDLTENGRERPRGDVAKKQLGVDLMEMPGCLSFEELEAIGAHATQREVNAEGAERELRNFLVLQLLEGHIGETYSGVVSSVMPRGIFVQIDKYLAEGFLEKDKLPGDVTRGGGGGGGAPSWRIDGRTGALVDIRSGRSFSVGDRVNVTIAAVDLAKRQLELAIADASGRAAGKAKQAVDRKGRIIAPADNDDPQSVPPRITGSETKRAGAGGGGGGAFGPAPGLGRKKGWKKGGPGAGGGGGGAMDGSKKRSFKSKTRDKGKKHHRRDP
jgi:ribonuclease R